MRWSETDVENKRGASGAPIQVNCDEEDDYVQCPCGRLIRSPREYVVFLMNIGEHEISLLCPNEGCYLEELGRIRFTVKGKSRTIEEASFNPFFFSWNSDRLGEERAKALLESHMKNAIDGIDWLSVIDRLKISR